MSNQVWNGAPQNAAYDGWHLWQHRETGEHVARKWNAGWNIHNEGWWQGERNQALCMFGLEWNYLGPCPAPQEAYNQYAKLRAEAERFIKRVEAGEVRSKRTYAAFKAILGEGK